MLTSKQELTIQVAHLDCVHVYYVELCELELRNHLEYLTTYASNSNHQYTHRSQAILRTKQALENSILH